MVKYGRRKSRRTRKSTNLKRRSFKVRSRTGRKRTIRLKKLIRKVALGTSNLKTCNVIASYYTNTGHVYDGESKACWCLTGQNDIGAGNTSWGVWPPINVAFNDNTLISNEGFMIKTTYHFQLYNTATQNAIIVPIKGWRVIIFSVAGSNFIGTTNLGPGIAKWTAFIAQSGMPD